MPILELCAGYDGLGMAVEALTGDRVTHVAENDPMASLVLAMRLPGVPNIGDISVYDWALLLGLVDIIAAGFPCQDSSNAGPRTGIDGTRFAVWKHVAAAIRVLQPRIVFLENVSAIRNRRRGQSRVLGDLAALGYDARWVCVRASELVGAAHHRDRWFCIAVPHAEGFGRAARWAEHEEQQGGVRRPAGRRSELPADTDGEGLEVRGVEPARSECPSAERSGVGPQDADSATREERCGAASGEEARGGHGPTLDDEVSFLLPHADSIGRDGRTGDQPEPEGRGESADSGHSPAEWWGDYLPAIRRWEVLTGTPAPAPTELGPRGGRRLTAVFAEWLMGLPAGWVTDVEGLTRADQLHKIGNGAMPQQAYAAYRYLLQSMAA